MVTCEFEAIPRGVLSDGSVRFYPRSAGSYGAVGATTFVFTFGDGSTAASWGATVHDYGIVTSASPVTVSLTVRDSTGATGTTTHTNFLTLDLESNVEDVPTNGTYHQVSVLIWDSTSAMLANRTPWTDSNVPPLAYCNLMLLSPKVVNSIDKIGTATFSLLDIGNATSTERSLISEGKNVAIIMGKSVVFSGLVRRCTQNIQNGFGTTNRVKQWDFECDSDLARLKYLNVSNSALGTYGATLDDTPGNIIRKLLTPISGETDTRGIICCTDTTISYQLNSAYSTAGESVGNRYEHVMAIQNSTNYDIRSRPNSLIYTASFDGTNVVTISGASFTTNEFATGTPSTWVLFAGVPGKNGITSYGKVVSNTSNTITITAVNPSAAPTTNATVIILRGYYIDFAPDLSQPSPIVNYNVNKDVFEYSDNDDKRKLSTKIVVDGKDIRGDTISVMVAGVHAFDNTSQFFRDSTRITKKMDGYIYKNGYYDGGLPASVKPNIAYGVAGKSYLETWEIALYGWGYSLQVGDAISLVNNYSTASNTVATTPSEQTDSNGTKYTVFAATGGFTYDYSGNGFLMSKKQYVEDNAVVSGTVLIGEEPFSISSTGTDYTNGKYIATTSTRPISSQKSYPHGIGALVARTNYTEASPESGSPIATYGLYIDNRTVDSGITFGQLDAYATSLLLGLGNFYKKATAWGTIFGVSVPRVGWYYAGVRQQSITEPPMVGDRVEFTEYSGATPEEFQIVSTTIDCDAGRISLECGDFEKNVFTSLEQKTSAVNRTLT